MEQYQVVVSYSLKEDVDIHAYYAMVNGALDKVMAIPGLLEVTSEQPSGQEGQRNILFAWESAEQWRSFHGGELWRVLLEQFNHFVENIRVAEIESGA